MAASTNGIGASVADAAAAALHKAPAGTVSETAPVSPQVSQRFDPNFTQHVIDTMGPKVTPRNREVFTAMFRHLHDFAREIELTTDEWMAGIKFAIAVGQISSPTRNEAHRITDILGLES